MQAYFYITYQIPPESEIFEQRWPGVYLEGAIKSFKKAHKGCDILRVLTCLKGDSRLKKFDKENPFC